MPKVAANSGQQRMARAFSRFSFKKNRKKEGVRGEEKGDPFSPRPRPLAHPLSYHAIRNALAHVPMGMGTYVPHQEGTVQSIVRLSLTRYQGYANPPQVVVDRLEQFAACADWTRDRIAD